MIYIILAMLLYTLVVLFGAAAARNASATVVAAVVNTVSAIVPLLLVIPIISKKVIVSEKTGIMYAVCGGIAVALFTLAFNKAFAVNKVAIVSPIVFGGTIVLTTIASYFLFKEKVSVVQGLGLLLLLSGLSLVIYARATGK